MRQLEAGLRSFGQGFLGGYLAPPSISGVTVVGSDGIRVNIAGALGATHTIGERSGPTADWTPGLYRTGDGLLTQTGLDPGRHEVMVVSTYRGRTSWPSAARVAFIPEQAAGYISTAVRAVWAALRAGARVAPYMAEHNGHFYDEAVGSKKSLSVTRSDMPAIIMTPGADQIVTTAATNISHDVAVPLNFDLRIEAEDVDTITAFYELVLGDLHAAFIADKFGLPASVGLWLGKPPASAVISKIYEQAGPKENPTLIYAGWSATFAYILVFRRRVEI